MLDSKPLTSLVEQLHRALKAQAHYAQDHPQSVQSAEAALACLKGLLAQESPIILTQSRSRMWHAGRVLDGAPNATQALAKELDERGWSGLAFHAGLEADDLQLLFFALALRPTRLAEMGGPGALFPDDGNVRVLLPEPPAPAPTVPSTPPDLPPLEVDWDRMFGKAEPDAGPQASASAPVPAAPAPGTAPPIPDPEDALPTPATLEVDLRSLFAAVLQMTAAPPRPSATSPWPSEQREVLAECGFLIPDFASVQGTGLQLCLGRVDPLTLRDALRKALNGLDALSQGCILLGLPSFPSEEQALRRALDYLGPELLAQAVADAHLRLNPSRFTLALLVAAFLHCVKDRELSLEAIRGRLQFEGWTIQDVDALKDAILWECHGTDTKLRMSLMDRGVFELDAHQVAILLRQLLRGKRDEGLKDLLHQLEGGFASPEVRRRRHAAEIVADLAECLETPGLGAEAEQRLHQALHEHLVHENDPQAAQWSCQSLEAILGHWLRSARFEAVYREMLALGELALARMDVPDWKAQAIRDLLFRVASPANMGALLELLHHPAQMSSRELHALLALLGRPAAQFLVNALENEPQPDRRGRLQDALRAIGRNAVPPLREALGSPQPSQVVAALDLLRDIGHASALPDVNLAMEHRDPSVQRAAVRAVAALAAPGSAAQLLAELLPKAAPGLQLEILAQLGDLRAAETVPCICDLLQGAKGTTEDVQRLRLRAVEALGLIGTESAIPALADLFRKKGLIGGRESTAMRLAAARSLAAINTREARETIALAMDSEPHEDVRAVLRQILVGGNG